MKHIVILYVISHAISYFLVMFYEIYMSCVLYVISYQKKMGVHIITSYRKDMAVYKRIKVKTLTVRLENPYYRSLPDSYDCV